MPADFDFMKTEQALAEAEATSKASQRKARALMEFQLENQMADTEAKIEAFKKVMEMRRKAMEAQTAGAGAGAKGKNQGPFPSFTQMNLKDAAGPLMRPKGLEDSMAAVTGGAAAQQALAQGMGGGTVEGQPPGMPNLSGVSGSLPGGADSGGVTGMQTPVGAQTPVGLQGGGGQVTGGLQAPATRTTSVSEYGGEHMPGKSASRVTTEDNVLTPGDLLQARIQEERLQLERAGTMGGLFLEAFQVTGNADASKAYTEGVLTGNPDLVARGLAESEGRMKQMLDMQVNEQSLKLRALDHQISTEMTQQAYYAAQLEAAQENRPLETQKLWSEIMKNQAAALKDIGAIGAGGLTSLPDLYGLPTGEISEHQLMLDTRALADPKTGALRRDWGATLFPVQMKHLARDNVLVVPESPGAWQVIADILGTKSGSDRFAVIPVTKYFDYMGAITSPTSSTAAKIQAARVLGTLYQFVKADPKNPNVPLLSADGSPTVVTPEAMFGAGAGPVIMVPKSGPNQQVADIVDVAYRDMTLTEENGDQGRPYTPDLYQQWKTLMGLAKLQERMGVLGAGMPGMSPSGPANQ